MCKHFRSNEWRGRKVSRVPQGLIASKAPSAELEHRLTVVHPLLFCPPIPKGERYELVARTWWGERHVLASGRTHSPHDTLNLARVRQTAARLGANEVHILA